MICSPVGTIFLVIQAHRKTVEETNLRNVYRQDSQGLVVGHMYTGHGEESQMTEDRVVKGTKTICVAGMARPELRR